MSKPYLLLALLVGLSAHADLTQPKRDLELASVSAMTTDLTSGEVLVEKHADAVLSVASVTKIMTAMVVLDSAEPLSTYLTIQDWSVELAKNAYSRIRIGSQAKRSDLLRVALMSSENRAAFNLGAHHPGGLDAFVTAMNAKARALGMLNTTFVDPMGLSPENRSTASDLSKMISAAFRYDVIRSFSTTRQHTVDFKGPRYQLGYGNTNPLTGSSTWEVKLTKTGYLNEAGRCLVMVTEANQRPVTMVMLNSFGKRSPLGDAARMRRWIESGAESKIATAAKDYEKKMLQQHGLSNTQGE